MNTWCRVACKHIAHDVEQHIDRGSLGNWRHRNICERDIRGRPSFASGMCVCVCESAKRVCVVLQEYYVTWEWCNAFPGTSAADGEIHLWLTWALQTSWPERPAQPHAHSQSHTSRASCSEMMACQSIRIFFPCHSGLKHLIHFIPWQWSPKSAHLLWATDFVRSKVVDCLCSC